MYTSEIKLAMRKKIARKVAYTFWLQETENNLASTNTNEVILESNWLKENIENFLKKQINFKTYLGLLEHIHKNIQIHFPNLEKFILNQLSIFADKSMDDDLINTEVTD